MTRPISAGDLVMVVRCCCTGYVTSSPVFVVAAVKSDNENCACEACGADLPSGKYASDDVGKAGFPLSWLKRIDPLPENETIEHNEEVGA